MVCTREVTSAWQSKYKQKSRTNDNFRAARLQGFPEKTVCLPSVDTAVDFVAEFCAIPKEPKLLL